VSREHRGKLTPSHRPTFAERRAIGAERAPNYAFGDRWFKINVTTDQQGALVETGAPQQRNYQLGEAAGWLRVAAAFDELVVAIWAQGAQRRPRRLTAARC